MTFPADLHGALAAATDALASGDTAAAARTLSSAVVACASVGRDGRLSEPDLKRALVLLDLACDAATRARARLDEDLELAARGRRAAGAYRVRESGSGT